LIHDLNGLIKFGSVCQRLILTEGLQADYKCPP
jgi:hypothetical protein